MKKNSTIFQLKLKSDAEVAKTTRNNWGVLRPTSRVVESKKIYKRTHKSWKKDY